MKAIVCEMCNSNDVVKQDGMYVCQSCGTKYSTDEAKKLMVEIDNSEKVKNYLILARRAKETGNLEDGQKYYDLLRQELPNDWEANFYVVYFRALNCKIAEIASAARSVSNCLPAVFGLVKEIEDNEERKNAIDEVCYRAFLISDILGGAANKHYNEISDSIKSRFLNANITNTIESGTIKKVVCDSLCEIFINDEAAFTAGIPYIKRRVDEGIYDPSKYINSIKKYEPDYQGKTVNTAELERKTTELRNQIQSNNTKTGGCYVATAVYGSYDCPQVWTLRRYRDDTLAATWYGRAFIHTYYAISPTLVKWFGDAAWFKNMWKPKLDRMVMRLNQEGVESTPYQDKNW